MFKKIRSAWPRLLLISVGLVSLFLLTGSLGLLVLAAPAPVRDVATPLTVALKIDRAPTVGQTATLSCTAQTARAAPNTSVNLVLPSSVVLVTGNASWQGNLQPNQPVQLTATVRLNAPGKIELACRARRVVSKDEVWGDLKSVYLSVGQTASQMGFGRMGIPYGGYKGNGEGQPKYTPVDVNAFGSPGRAPSGPLPTTTALRKGAAAKAAPAAPTGSLIVTGRWAYYDRNGNYVGANQFLIDLADGNGNHLAWCFTDTGGYYSCPAVTNPGSTGVRTYLRSWVNYNPYGDTLGVFYPPCGTGITCSYPVQTGTVVFADGTHDIGEWFVTQGDTYNGAYWIKDDLDRAWKFVAFNITDTPTETSGPGLVLWAYDSTDGDYYNTNEYIHLTGSARLSHDTSIHEYGHETMWNKYQWWPITSCPSPHYIQYWSAYNCAWTEGWADFFPLAVNNDPVYHWADGGTLNLETPTWNTSGWDNGDGVEGRVAGALYDIWDSNNDGEDTYSDGLTHIWDVLFHQTDNNFAEYWAAWLARGHAHGPAVMAIYQNAINYRTGPFNDDFGYNTNIGTMPYSTVEDTTWATTQASDPAFPCGNHAQGSASVWFRYTPSVHGRLHVDTVGTNYDTVLGVWTGTWGSLTNVACDDDSGGSYTSSLDTPVNAGTTYYIEAVRYATGLAPSKKAPTAPTGGGGSLHLAATFTTCYSLTTVASPTSEGSVGANPAANCGTGRYTTGSVVNLTASPVSGMYFVGWSGDASGIINPLAVTMNGNKNITARFAPLNDLFANGTSIGIMPYSMIEDTTNATTETNDPVFPCGNHAQGSASVWFRFTPSVNGKLHVDTIGSSYDTVLGVWTGSWGSLTNVACNDDFGGSATSSLDTPVNAGTTYYIEAVRYTSGLGPGKKGPPAPRGGGGSLTLAASFTQCYSLTTSAIPSGGGTVGVNPGENCGTGRYTSGTSVTLTATANSSYGFVNWSGDASGTANPVQITMNGTKSVTANFLACYSLTTSVNPSGSGTVTASAPNCGSQYLSGTVVTLGANANTGYTFNNWSGDATGTTSPVQVAMNGNKNVTANFIACYTLTTAANPTGGGTVAATAPNCGSRYRSGTVVTLTATPNSSYAFGSWSGDATGTTNPVQVTMNSNKNLTANFLACYSLTTSVNPGGTGTVSASAPNCASKYVSGTIVTLTATPNSGYAFGSWSGDASGATNPLALTMNGNKNVTANMTVENDDIDHAIVVGAVPFSHAENTTTATTAGDDPVLTCGSHTVGSKSVWYKITPATAGILSVTTDGTAYDTVLAVWTGTRGALSAIACNDNWGGGSQSTLRTDVKAGKSYFVEVTAGPTGTAGGALQIQVNVLANRLQNSGFEIDLNNDARPDIWSICPYFYRTSAVKLNNAYGGMFTATTPATSSVSQVINGVKPGQLYYLGAWVKIPATTNPFTFKIRLRWSDASGAVLRTDTVATFTGGTNKEWSQVLSGFTAPDGAAKVTVLMNVNSLKNTIYVDSMTFGK